MKNRKSRIMCFFLQKMKNTFFPIFKKASIRSHVKLGGGVGAQAHDLVARDPLLRRAVPGPLAEMSACTHALSKGFRWRDVREGCRQASYFSDSRYGGRAILPGPPVAPAGYQGCRAMTLAELCGPPSRLPRTPLCWPGSWASPPPPPR